MKQAILAWDYLIIFFKKCYLTKRQVNFKMKVIIWELKVMWEHILYTFCFQNVKAESWGGGGVIFFSPACQVELHKLLQWFLPLHLQQIPLCRLISIIFPKGSLDPVPSAEESLSMERWCTLSVLSPSETCRAAFSLTGRSLFLPGIWHSFLSPAAFHQHRGMGQNRPCKQGGDAVQKEKTDLRNIWISKVSGLMGWAASIRQTAVSLYSAILQASCSLPSQGGHKSENSHHHQEKKYMSCLASVKSMGISRMMLLHRCWVNKVGLTWPQIFNILMYFLIL